MSDDGLSPVKRALLEIRELRARLAALEAGPALAPLAIVGIGLRMPGGANDAAGMSELLWSATDAVGPVPADRWDERALYDPDPDAPGRTVTRHGAFLTGIDRFDADFFGISPREAAGMDPQQRILLEVAWHALEDAGYAGSRLEGSRTGVYVGISNGDYGRLVFDRPDRLDAYAASGNAFSVAAGRISYCLGLRGPSLAVDTACSSSLVALHLAAQALRAGECDLALAGGINLILTPEMNITFSKARMMAADGRCKTFDAAADGYVRGEGAGVAVLKRLSDALAAGDRILAVVHGSAVNQDGSSNGLTAPNGPAQEAVIRAALAQGGVAPAEISFVETHGTGTPLGDPIEAGALAAVFAAGRDPAAPLLLGSVKTNLGHLEAAAGIAGVIKVILSLRNRAIPPNLHFRTGNPRIDWADLPLAIPTAVSPWTPAGRRIAGVSSFGFSGTNAHVVLGEAPPEARRAASAGGPFLLPLSARDPATLLELAARYEQFLGQPAFADRDALADACFTAGAGRRHFPHRLAVAGESVEDLRAGLAAFVTSIPHPAVAAGQSEPGAPAVAFVFGDEDLPEGAAVAALAANEPAFRAAVDACAATLEPVLDLPAVLRNGAAHAPEARFAVAYALAELWQSWGIRPEIVTGMGVGACVAACVAGYVSLTDAMALAGARRNGASAVRAALEVVAFAHPRLVLLSETTGRPATTGEVASAEFWLGSPAGVTAGAPARPDLAAHGITHALGIGIGSDAVRLGEPGVASVPVFLDGTALSGPDVSALQQLYAAGADIDWEAVAAGRGRRRAELPLYPFRRRRYWLEPAAPVPDPWPATERELDRQSEQGPIDLDAAAYPAIWPSLEALTVAHALALFRDGGVFAAAGERRTLDDVLAACGIVAAHRRLTRRWLRHLTAHGYLESDGDAFVAVRALPAPDLEARWAEAEARLAGNPQLLAYLRNCGRLLDDVVRGRVSAVETFYPGGSFELARDLYERSATMRYVNALVARGVGAYARGVGRPVRVLEVGAGSGATTAALLPMLDAASAYVFTDVSATFLDAARERFASPPDPTQPSLAFGLFDMDRDPAEQGFADGTFDLIVSANAVHTSADLPVALARLRRLLAPGGALMLVESTTDFAWFDMSTGLVEGWQHFTDEGRRDQPLLSAPQWRGALSEAGFFAARTWPAEGSAAEALGQHLVVGRNAGAAGAGVPLPAVGTWPEVATSAAGAASATGEAGRASAAEQASSALREELARALPHERDDLLRDFARGHVMRVLGRPADNPPGLRDRLMDIGVDSLMAVQLRNRLGAELGLERALPATLLFDHPTIEALAAALAAHLADPGPDAAIAGGTQPAGAPPNGAAREEAGGAPAAGDILDEAAVAALSEAEIEALVMARLEEPIA